MSNIQENKIGNNQVRILWIEDDTFLGELIAERLRGEGYEVTYVVNGEDALKEANEPPPPDMILSDIMLPGVDGFEILESVKKDERLRNVPVILFSNLNHEDDVNKGIEMGAANFLIKANVTPDQVVEQIKILLAEKQ